MLLEHLIERINSGCANSDGNVDGIAMSSRECELH